MKKRTTEEMRQSLESFNYVLLDEYLDARKKLKMRNPDGYIVYGFLYNIKKGKAPRAFDKSNPDTINNINLYLKRRFNKQFICISEEYNGDREELIFKCMNCNTVFSSKWININKQGETRSGLICPNCGGRNESLHALILKQVFLNEYPDTILEDKSCVNPLTNKVMPTDIVNHRLKIAVEIQSEWHDRENIKIKDQIKKEYWINKGYHFFDPDIRDYTILEMIQIFFQDINEIPEYINYNFSNKLNIKQIQDLLNSGMTVINIAKELNINERRIYDAIYSKKLRYPDTYIPECNSKVVQLDELGNYINTYNSYVEAGKANNINASAISQAIQKQRYYSGGYFWVKYKDYIINNYQLKSRFTIEKIKSKRLINNT